MGRKLLADQRELGFALAGAATTGQALRVAELQAELLQDAMDHGQGNLDIAAIIEAIQRRRPDPSSETSTAPTETTATATA